MAFLTDEAIDRDQLISEVRRRSDGALALVEGIVRDLHEGRAVESIVYDAYRPMAEKEIAKIVEALRVEFPSVAVTLRHRLGLVIVGETAITIACSSPHRAEAFAACRAVIDRVKQTVPIWKKERGPDGEVWTGWQC